ncbi:nucleotide-diphospho-sugar transferase family protein [Actinidia rufa]|uniref:Nucleotide-diphospho-sugar transferase family protein n=1 Tax=Actinidia rufa TaxID=165716 RepID=A0A7J0FDE0_9ERIC|nr:nucleotide-diphospho-sugar transferase family protein [Actinidia rufa]
MTTQGEQPALYGEATSVKGKQQTCRGSNSGASCSNMDIKQAQWLDVVRGVRRRPTPHRPPQPPCPPPQPPIISTDSPDCTAIGGDWCHVLHSLSFCRFFPVSAPLFLQPSSRSIRKWIGEVEESFGEGKTRNDRTVIITTLNEAWAAPNSIFDVFLESFEIGNQTQRLVNHLVVVALDQKAYSRCLALHPHCYALSTNGKDFSSEALFMTTDYLEMMWRRIHFLHSVLKLGYNFVLTDADIIWFRDPFSRFYSDGDIQIACDFFWGNSSDRNNLPNGDRKVHDLKVTLEDWRKFLMLPANLKASHTSSWTAPQLCSFIPVNLPTSAKNNVQQERKN